MQAQTDRKVGRQTERLIARHTGWGRQDRQAGRQVDRQTSRQDTQQMDRFKGMCVHARTHAHSHTHTHTYAHTHTHTHTQMHTYLAYLAGSVPPARLCCWDSGSTIVSSISENRQSSQSSPSKPLNTLWTSVTFCQVLNLALCQTHTYYCSKSQRFFHFKLVKLSNRNKYQMLFMVDQNGTYRNHTCRPGPVP